MLPERVPEPDHQGANGHANGHANLPALAPERGVGDPRYYSAAEGEEIRLRDYWDVLLRHRWTVLAFFVTVVAGALLLTLVALPTYKGTTLVEIRAEGQKLVTFQDVMQMSQAEREFYQTQYDVLRSRSLAKRVIDRLQLAEDEVFDPPDDGPGVLSTMVERARGLLLRAAPRDVATEEVRAEEELIDRFLADVDVSPRRNSYLVEVSFFSVSPGLAARVANALADEYVGMSLDQRIAAVQKGRAFIEKQLGVTKAALAHSEEQLQAFARQNEILTVDTKQNIEYQKLRDLNDGLTKAQHERLVKEALANQVSASDAAQLSQIVNNPVIANLTSDLARREADRARLGETFTSDYPRLRRLDAQIGSLRTQIKNEQLALAAALRVDHEAARKQEALLAKALDEQKAIVNDLNARAIDYKILKREVDTNRSVYNSLLQRLKEVEVTEGIKASNIHVVDAAAVPVHPHRPRPLFNLAVAILIGSLGGIGLAFMQEHLDNSVKNPEDVERYLRLPTLGALPLLKPRRANASVPPETSPELIVIEDPKSMSAEALRTLRASLFLSTAAGPPQRLLVTSARPQEGKTCVSSNLAIVLAQMGRKVVLVDCDFRRPRVHRVFGLELERGATSFLSGNADLPSVIHHTPYGIDVVCGGPVPPNPVELIDSASMVSLVEELSRRYDFVLLDAPPSLGFADVPLLARLVGGVLFVVHAGHTPRKAATNALDHLQRLRARILGVVLNGVRTGGAGYYSSYYGYYSYYQYGDRERDGDAPMANGHDRALDGPHADA
jgi:capsular exopolysaccharide synthesis family protein